MKSLSAPVRFVIDITYQCNMRCIHCHANAARVSPSLLGTELTTAELATLLHDLNEMRVFDITITGGEALLRPDIFKIIGLQRQLDFSTITLITNGSLITSESARRLADSGLRQARISLDGLGPMNNDIRGPGCFEKTVEGIKHLLPFIPGLKVLTVLMKSNYKEFPALTEYLSSIGVTRQDVIPVRRLGRASELLGLSLSETEWIYDEVRKLQKKLYPSFHLELNCPLMGIKMEPAEFVDIASYTEQERGAGATVIPNGDIFLNRLWGNERLGNIKQTRFPVIWANTIGRRLQKKREIARKETTGELARVYYNI